MTKIEFYDPYNDTVLGEWARSGESIIADPDTQSILDAALGRAKPDKVWEQYRSWTNGYIASREVGDETKADPRDHVSIGRFPRDLTDFEQAAWVAQREAFRSETKADPRDGDGDGWIGEGTKHKRRASRRPSASISEVYAAATKSGPELPQGIQADVSIKVGPLGSVVVKDFGYGEAEAWWAEQKAAEFGEMLGVNMPRSFAPDDQRFVMDLVTTEDGSVAPPLVRWMDEEVKRRIGTVEQRLEGHPVGLEGNLEDRDREVEIRYDYDYDASETAEKILDEIVSTPEGGRIALFDYLTANNDRHDSNILMQDGKPVAIDHGLALAAEVYGPRLGWDDDAHAYVEVAQWDDDPVGMFATAWIEGETPDKAGSHKFSQEDLDAASEAIDYMDADSLPLERKVREGMRHRLLVLQRMMDDAA